MIGSLVAKVVWVGRATVFCVGLAVTLALIFGAASTAFASNGNPWLLGNSNVATAITSLGGRLGVDGPMVRITNNNTEGDAVDTDDTALDLRVQSGEPPMWVNSDTKVANLNADKLDGKNSTEFISGYQMVEAATDLNLTDGKFKYADCPTGMEVVGGGASAFGEYGKVVVVRSEPAAPPTSWYGQAFEIGAGTTGDWLLEVTAICADAQ